MGLGRMIGSRQPPAAAFQNRRRRTSGCSTDVKDRRVPHTRRSTQLSARGGLSGRHTRSDCQRKRERQVWIEPVPKFAADEVSLRMKVDRLSGHPGRQNRFNCSIRSVSSFRYNPIPLHDPCHSHNRHNRYNPTFRRTSLSTKALQLQSSTDSWSDCGVCSDWTV